MHVQCLFLAATIGIGLVYAQSAEPKLPENFSLPPELQNKVDEKDLKVLQNKSQAEFKKKCEQNGGPEAFTNAQNAFGNFTKCLQSLVDPEVLQQEIEEAKPNGMVDEVFKKYCQKKPQFKGCFNSLTEASKPCFTVDERKNLKTIYNVSDQLAEFICFKEGDRIALFIAEGGQECFQEKSSELQACLNKTLGGNFNVNVNNFTGDDLPSLSFDEKQCNKMSDMQVCVVGVLETCQKPTSANIVESLFKFVRKVTPCKAFKDPTYKSDVPDAASGLTVTAATIAMGMFAALILV